MSSTCCKPAARLATQHLRPSPSTSTSTTTQHLLPRVQVRHESTTRRHKKLLTVQQTPSYTPNTADPTIVFNPPSSAPTPFHTPLKFLPKTDARRALYASFLSTATQRAHRNAESPVAAPGTPLSVASMMPPKPSSGLPPAVRAPYEKKYHLGPGEIAEIQRLRAEDPRVWTRVRLAEKFGCSQFFVGMVAKNVEAGVRVAKEDERARARWGERRREARVGRERRKELWGRDA